MSPTDEKDHIARMRRRSLLVGIGLVLVPIVGLAWLILVVPATIRASND